MMARARKAPDQGQKPLGRCYLGGAVHYWAILAVTPTGILLFVALLTYKYNGKGQKGLGLQGQKPWVSGSMLSWQCCSLLGHLGGGPYWDSFFVALLTNKYDGKGQKGLGSQGQKPLGQCYLGSAVHYWAILVVAPTGILSVAALLTNNYDGKGQKGYRIAGPKALWVNAILAVLFISEPF